MKFKTQLERFSDELWHFHISVPEKVSKKYVTQESKRVLCKLNDQLEFQCGLMPKGDGTYFINVNKEIRTKLKLEIGQTINVEIRKDESKYGLPIPEELEELLKIDEEGDQYFHSLTPGKQRSLIYIIGKPKTSDTRLKKALAVIDYLKATHGKIDFKELNLAIKNYKEF